MVTDKQFRIIMNGLWPAYASSMSVINAMENMGCNVEPRSVDSVGVETPFSKLYGAQDAAMYAIRDLMGIDDDDFLSDLDEFFTDAYAECPETGRFPEEKYQALYDLMAGYGGIITLEDKSYRFTGKRIDNGEIVRGYLWNGADHAYIIPHNIGINYDAGTKHLNAHAVEVEKESIR